MKSLGKWGALCAIGLCAAGVSAVGGQARADTYIVTHTGTVLSQDSGRDVFFSTWHNADLTGLQYKVVFTYTFDPSNLINFSVPQGTLDAFPGDGTTIGSAVVTIGGISWSTAQSEYLTDVAQISRVVLNPGYNTDYTTQTVDYLGGGQGALDFTISSPANFVGSTDFRVPFSYTLTDADRANPQTSTYFTYSGASFVFSDETISTQYIAGVPEPAAWSLMIVGFIGAGAMLRNRRRIAFAA